MYDIEEKLRKGFKFKRKERSEERKNGKNDVLFENKIKNKLDNTVFSCGTQSTSSSSYTHTKEQRTLDVACCFGVLDFYEQNFLFLTENKKKI